jgi:hypothetical protein
MILKITFILLLIPSIACAWWSNDTATRSAETRLQANRIIADGGTVVDTAWMNKVIKTLKNMNIYSDCKFIAGANLGFKNAGSNKISTLYDVSQYNNDMTQSVDANRPIWTAAQQNGKAVATFDGTNDAMDDTSMSVTGLVHDLTLFVVYNPVTLTHNEGIVSFAASSDDWNNEDSFTFCQFTVGGKTNNFFRGFSDPNTLDIRGASAGAAAFHLVTTQLSAGTGYMWTDGANQLSDTYSNTNQIDLTRVGLGARLNAGAGFSVWGHNQIGIVILCAGALTTAQRTEIETLINSYYAIY